MTTLISREKLSKKIWVKNSWKCWSFVKIHVLAVLDKNLTFRIVCSRNNEVIIISPSHRACMSCQGCLGPTLASDPTMQFWKRNWDQLLGNTTFLLLDFKYVVKVVLVQSRQSLEQVKFGCVITSIRYVKPPWKSTNLEIVVNDTMISLPIKAMIRRSPSSSSNGASQMTVFWWWVYIVPTKLSGNWTVEWMKKTLFFSIMYQQVLHPFWLLVQRRIQRQSLRKIGRFLRHVFP